MKSRAVAAVILTTIGAGLVPVSGALAAAITSEVENQLLINVEPAGGWTVKQFQNLVEVRFPDLGENLVPDTSLVERTGTLVQEIGVERIGEDAVLRITMACSCKVAVLGRGTEQVLVNIIDPEPVQNGDRALSGVSARADPLRSPLPVGKPAQSDETVLAEGDLNPAMVTERLVEQLRRAAAAGFVELDPEQTLIPVANPDPPPEPEVEQADLPEDTSPEEATLMADEALVDTAGAPAVSPDLESQAAEPDAYVDAGLEKVPAHEFAEDEPKCFGDESFLFADSVGSAQFIEALRTHRRDLVGEFDASVPATAIALSRTYLAQALADEALAVVSEFATADPESLVIAEMARALLDPADATILHLRKPECVGDQALWRAYIHAASGADAEALAAEEVSGRALERLPKPLREIIGARIGHAAANVGDWNTARRMEAMITRARSGVGRRNGDSLLLSARLAEWHDEPGRAWDLRQQTRAGEVPHKDRALLELAETVLQSAAFLKADTGDLQLELGALSHEARGTPIGAAAFELEARLAARGAGQESVVDLLAEGVRAGILKPDERVDLLSELLSEPSMTELSRPVGLIYLEQPEVFAESLEQPGFRHAVIRSLSELGLPHLADPLLRVGDEREDSVVEALAIAHLENGDPRRALDLARGLGEATARDMLMAAALSASGHSARAIPYLSATAPELRRDDLGDLHVLQRTLRSAMENGDLAAAQTAGQKILSSRPTKDMAEQVVMLALMQGADEMPRSAEQVLEDIAPQRRNELQMLFARVPGVESLEDPAATTALLNRLDVEIGLLEGLLAGG